jgi:hypothetical protein
MKTARLILTTMMVLAVCAAMPAQDDPAVRSMPGFIDLDLIQIPVDAEEVTEVTLGPQLLKMAMGTEENGDSNLSEALEGIASIRIKAFDVTPEQGEQMRPIVEQFDQQLKADGWQQLVRVKEGKELVVVSMLNDPADERRMAGLFIMAFDPSSDAAFINIVGTIDFSKMGKLLESMDNVDLNLDELGKINISEE